MSTASTTSWERLVHQTMLQAPAISTATGCPVRTLRGMGLAAGRLEGGPYDEPGIGDRHPSGHTDPWESGPALGWYQFNIGEVPGRSWQPEGRGMLNSGWRIADFYDEQKIVEYWLPRLGRMWVSLGDIPDRERQAIFRCERPRHIYNAGRFGMAWEQAMRAIDDYADRQRRETEATRARMVAEPFEPSEPVEPTITVEQHLDEVTRAVQLDREQRHAEVVEVKGDGAPEPKPQTAGAVVNRSAGKAGRDSLVNIFGVAVVGALETLPYTDAAALFESGDVRGAAHLLALPLIYFGFRFVRDQVMPRFVESRDARRSAAHVRRHRDKATHLGHAHAVRPGRLRALHGLPRGV